MLLQAKKSIVDTLQIYSVDDKNYQIRAVACDFQHIGILTSVDSDEPVQPPYKLRNSK